MKINMIIECKITWSIYEENGELNQTISLTISIKKELEQNQRYFHYIRNWMEQVTETEFIVYLMNINKEHSQKEKEKAHVNNIKKWDIVITSFANIQ